jgi:hypothetical protein
MTVAKPKISSSASKLIVINLTNKSNVKNLINKDNLHDIFQIKFIFVFKIDIRIIFEILKVMDDKLDTLNL